MSILAFGLKDFFPRPELQIPALVVLIVIIVIYVRYRRKQM